MLIRLLLCCLLLWPADGLAQVLAPAPAPAPAQVPAQAPAQATAPARLDYDGLMDRIAQAKGRVAVVAFWATWCGPCLKEMPELRQLRQEVPQDVLEIIAVSFDYDEAAHAAWLARNPLRFPAYLASPELMGLLDIKSIPRTLLFDASGLAILQHEGYLPPDVLRQKLREILPPDMVP